MSVVPISGTKELASRTTNIAWRTRSDTFVLIPLLELTLAVVQHHAGFIFEITLVHENVGVGRCVYPNKKYTRTVGAGSACPDIVPMSWDYY